MDNILTGTPESFKRVDENVVNNISNLFTESDEKRVLRESMTGEAGGLSYEQIIQSQLPAAKHVPGEDPKRHLDSNLESGKWDTFVSNASRFANTDLTGFSHFVYKNFIGYDNGYNPYKDPSLLEQSTEFQIKYARDFMDSPNSTYTAGQIKRIKETEEMLRKSANEGGAALAGTLVGSTANISNLIALRFALGGNSVLSAATNTGVSSTLSVALQGAAQRQYDPTITPEEIAYSSAGAFVLGSALGAIGGSFSKAGTEELARVMTPSFKEQPLKTIDEILAEGSSAGAMSKLADGGHGLAETNNFFKGVSKTLNVGAEQDGLRSASKSTRYLTNLFTSHNFRTTGNFEGKATPVSLNNIADAELNMGLQPAVEKLDVAFASFKKEGGALDQHAFLNEAFEVYAGLHKTSSRATSEAASAYKDFFKHFAGRHQSVDPNFKPREDYIPGIADRRSVIRNQADLYRDIRDELLQVARKEEIEFTSRPVPKKGTEAFKKHQTALSKRIPLDPDDPAFQDAVEAIFERMALDSAGNFNTRGEKFWDNMNLKPRTLNFSNAFYNKYRPTDVMKMLTSYARKSSKSLVSKTYLGSSDPYTALDMIKADYTKMIAEVTKRTDIPNGNKLIAKLHKGLENDLDRTSKLIEIFTGQALNKYSNVTRNTTAVLKAINYTITMGMAPVNMITDLVRAASSHLSQVGFADDILKHSKEVADVFKAVPDKSAGRLYGAVSDPLTGVSRSTMFADVIDVPVMTTVERGTQYASRLYSNLNLMEPINDITRKSIAEDVSRKILKLGRDLAEAKLDHSSFEGLELAKLGIDKELATKVLKEFDAHQEVVEFGGKKVLTTGIDSWDPNVAAYYIGAVQKAVNNTIIVPTAGSKPFWTNTPWGSVISALKSFTLVSLNKYLLPALQDLKGVHPRAASNALSVIIADLAMASQVQLIRDTVSGKDVKYDTGYVMTSALTKNATFAILGLADSVAGLGGMSAANVFGGKSSYYYNQADYIQGAVGIALGPVAAYPLNVFDVAWDANHGSYSEAEYRRTLRLIPGNNLLYWNWAIQQIGKRPTKQPQSENRF